MAHLAPMPSPIGIFPQFLAQGTETLVLKEKVLSLTGDDFHIKLANGTPILRVEGKVMSISGRKKVFDEQGGHLFDIVKEHFHLHATYRVEGAKGEKIMEVKSSLKCEFFFSLFSFGLNGESADKLIVMGSKATATFVSQSGKKEVLTMRGNWFDTSADIIDEAQGSMYFSSLPPFCSLSSRSHLFL